MKKISLKFNLILGLGLMVLGLISSNSLREYTYSHGGHYVIPTTVENNYYLLDQYNNKVQITKSIYIKQLIFAIMSTVILIIGWGLVVIACGRIALNRLKKLLGFKK